MERRKEFVQEGQRWFDLVRQGVSVYLRAAAVGIETSFIEGLAGAVRRALGRDGPCPDGKPCPVGLTRCGRKQPMPSAMGRRRGKAA